MFFAINHLKMLTLISLIIIHQINGLPIDNQENQKIDNQIIDDNQSDKLDDSNNDNINSKIVKRSTDQSFPSEQQMDKKLTHEDFKNIRKSCKVGDPIRDTCEKCALLTRSQPAFVYCCADKDGVRQFCQNYIDYELSVL